MSEHEHNWQWVSDSGDGTGDFWWCPDCGEFIWGDDPRYVPAVTTGSTNQVTYIPFMPPGTWGSP